MLQCVERKGTPTMNNTVLHPKVQLEEHEALNRLLVIAQGNTGQSRIVADFLLAWWNAGTCGAFDITSTWALDDAIVRDVLIVCGLAFRCRSGWRQLPWPVDDNYPGRLKADAGQGLEAGLA